MIGPRHGDEEAIQRAEQAHYLSRLLGELRASAETLPARVGEEVAVKDHLCGLLVTPGRGEHLPARALDRLTTATGHLAALVSLFTGRRAGPPPTRSTTRTLDATGATTRPDGRSQAGEAIPGVRPVFRPGLPWKPGILLGS